MSEFAKGLGSKITIKFTQPLIGDVSNNEGAFTVRGDEWTWVPDGTLENREFAVASTGVRPPPSVEDEYKTDEDWDSGSHDDTAARAGRLELAAEEVY